MKNILYQSVLGACLLLVNCKPKHNNSENEIVDTKYYNEKTFNPTFKGLGTEPFWNVEVDDHFVLYSTPEIKSEVFKRIDQPNSSLIVAKNKNGSIELKISKESCSDGMSDNTFDHKLSILLKNNKGSLQKNGCGTFMTPKLLQGKWELFYFVDEEIPANKFLKTPFFILEENSTNVTGNSSCNGFNGLVHLKENAISFSKLATSRMMCVHENMEKEFLKVLPTVTKYNLVNDELHLYEVDVLLMKFKKINK